MNTVFHLVSLLSLAALVALLLKAQRERDFIRSLLQERRRTNQQTRLYVESPSRFLRRFAAALQVPFEGQGPQGEAPQRLNPGLFTELFLHSGLSLIRCIDSKVGTPAAVVELRTVAPVVDGGLGERLSQALGGQVEVHLLPPTS